MFRVKKGHDINLADSEGNLALCLAAQHDHIESIEVLLQANANAFLAQLKEKKTALHVACEWGRVQTARLLLQHAPKLVISLDDQNRTPLHWACRNGHVPVVKLILEKYHPDPNVADNVSTPVPMNEIEDP